ncbi:hypothetical protein L7F22_063589 [Adiantum nelumboides]|nr:hypothetical protein [Adiantum nelumboides]
MAVIIEHINLASHALLLNGAIFTDQGELVSDDLVVGIINKALDGFPQTVAQVKKLDSILENQGTKVDKVLNFKIANSTLEEQIRGCWIHLASVQSYHKIFAPPKAPGKDDIAEESLIQQKDDIAEVLKSRSEVFHKQTKPLVDYYKEKGIVVALHAEKSLKELSL